ncbi:LysR family transcriptional regulator [Pseudomonas sp. LP_7_YM]|uniref:LysR family transcriptional regulator n=1 Tax=Pseudomonas sp. LP_7_YM TaxID=2485137 RepID=UPI00105EEA70|nr:LysR family transcriptional regulator [Pseudomonas sp. LP_7_YM]TDV59713.1 DNA-binding transcriptional LysR family regulator [Pseudomonas sp. LP_7_YM]
MASQLIENGNLPKRSGDVAISMASAMDLKLFRIFRAVVEAGGFTAAQIELNISLAAISKQISDLEIRLGMRLCTRGREKFCLTEEGKLIYEASLELFMALDNFRERVGNVRGELLGDLNIAVIDNTVSDAGSPLVAALKALQEKAPKARVRLNVAPLEEIEQGILKGRFAVGIVPVYSARDEFKVVPLYEEKSELYCSNTHPLFAMADEDIGEKCLAEAQFIDHAYAVHKEKLKLLGLRNVTAVATQVEAVAILIMTGRYLGYLPTHWAESYVQRDMMRSIKAHAFSIATPVKLLCKPNAPHNPLLEVFLETMQGRTEKL